MTTCPTRLAAAAARRQRIVEILATNPGIVTSDIASIMELSYPTISAALRHLVADNLIHSKRKLISQVFGGARFQVEYYAGAAPGTKPANKWRIPERDELLAALFGPAGGTTA